MTSTWAEQVVAAAAEAGAVLGGLLDRDWDAPAGDVAWSCRNTAQHMGHDLAKYAAQLAGRVEGSYLRFRVTVPADQPVSEVLRSVRACADMLGVVVDSAPADARAWHFGPTDASGFAAMGIGEVLLHTYDITRGLGFEWELPAALAQLVVSRLIEHAPAVDDPAAALLWATGRIDLPGLARVEHWVWHAAQG